MEISFGDSKHEKLVNDFRALSKKYDKKGRRVAKEIIATLDALKAANSLFEVPRAYRSHPVKGNYKGYFAVDVTNTHRVIFRPNHKDDPNFRIDNYKSIVSIEIVEIYTDYH